MISAEGWWRAGEPQQTKLDVALDVNEAGTFLTHFGTADAIRGAATSSTSSMAIGQMMNPISATRPLIPANARLSASCSTSAMIPK